MTSSGCGWPQPVERVALVGHSFGATVALLYAAARPESVAGAALIGLGPLDAQAADEARERLAAALGPEQRSAWATARAVRKAAAANGDAEASKRAFLSQFELSPPALVRDPDAGRHLPAARQADFDFDPAVHAALVADLDGLDQWSAVGRVRVPLLVLYGEHDFEPIGQATAIAQQVRHADVLLVPGAAHLPWLDQPAAVTAALRAFLGRVLG